MDITGNTVFVTGGTSGIGLGLALRLHARGNKVIIAGRRRALLDQITAEHAGIEGVELDVADPGSVLAVAGSVQRRFPEINVVINAAGVMLPEDFRTGGFLSTAETTVATNLLGPLRVIAAFTEFLATKSDAVIMNVSSGLAFVPAPFAPTYSATKAGVHALSVALRVQLADTSISVLELAPPAVRTALMNQAESVVAMPLDDFLTEVMAILEHHPEQDEILVENVRGLRFAEADGSYHQVLAALADASEGEVARAGATS